jgi:exodeoxyribonuclease VII large subunit
MYPRNVCLIASATGAAVRDMIEVFRRRWPATTLFVRHSRVQGDGAAEEIAEAIRQVNRHHAAGHLPLDVLILGRGGGSTEDLAAFNTEVVAQAIYQSKIPVVSAVGHEIDYTIADLVADVRAATPSHAVEVVAPDRTEVWEIVEQRRCRLLEAIKRTLSERRDRLALLEGRPVLRRPADRFREWDRRLNEWGERLVRSIQNRTTALKRDLGAIAQHLESLSPLAILARGYSLTRRIDSNDFIRSVDQVAVGDRIVTIVQHGSIISRVESTSV